VADACEHAERQATAFAKATAACRSSTRRRELEIGVAIPPRLFRPCVLAAMNERRRFEPVAHVAANQPLEARESLEHETETISRLASRDRDAVCPRRSSTDASRRDWPAACRCDCAGACPCKGAIACRCKRPDACRCCSRRGHAAMVVDDVIPTRGGSEKARAARANRRFRTRRAWAGNARTALPPGRMSPSAAPSSGAR